MSSPKKVLIYGGTNGWLGGLLVDLFNELGDTPICSKARLENLPAIEQELDSVKPDLIFNAAGKTGRPNIDWCEKNKEETLKVNVVGTLNLQLAASARNIHCTHFVTGCVYHYTKEGPHSIAGGVGFKETDAPNFWGSFYSKTKMHLEALMEATFGDSPMLLLRVRLPLGNDRNHRSLITKLLKYEYLVNIPNSISVLENVLPIAAKMAKDGRTGVYNYTNEGVISHNELMELYKEIVDPSVTWKNFTLEEQDKVCAAPRSNCHLDTSKIRTEYPELLPVKEAVRQAFLKLKQCDEEQEQEGKSEPKL